jgi:ubiquinone/menaquinone biosynthesis C-methylase UbiE
MEIPSAKYWEEITSKLSKLFKIFFDSEKSIIYSNIKRGKKIIDIGCGYGRTIEYSLKCNPKFILGIDHNPKVISLAKKYFKDNKKVTLKVGNSSRLPAKRNSFDYAILVGLYSNLGNKKEKTLKEIHRVLKKRGILISSAYNEDAFDERIRYYKKIKIPIKKIVGNTVYFPREIGDDVSEQFHKSDLVSQFSKAGFRILKLRKKGVGYVGIFQK